MNRKTTQGILLGMSPKQKLHNYPTPCHKKYSKYKINAVLDGKVGCIIYYKLNLQWFSCILFGWTNQLKILPVLDANVCYNFLTFKATVINW